jgi:ADP-heptose:LPS heptosyltransferase
LNQRGFFNLMKKLGLLRPHAHSPGMDKLPDAYFNQFDWGELVAILRRCRYFIGNDGGLMHLAACCGTKGKAIFGPSSVAKNKPYSKLMTVVATNYECQPCSMNDKGIAYIAGAITCPYQIRCLYSIKPEAIYEEQL